MDNGATIDLINSLVIDIPNYPKPGIIFRDVTPVFGDYDAFSGAVNLISTHFEKRNVTKVIGAEARGFIIGSAVAYAMHAGFVPARKPGKLPREVFSEEYDLEYGKASIEIHKDALCKDDVVLIVDDLAATGGTALAMAKLVSMTGAKIAGFGFLLELKDLNARSEIATYTDAEVYSILEV